MVKHVQKCVNMCKACLKRPRLKFLRDENVACRTNGDDALFSEGIGPCSHGASTMDVIRVGPWMLSSQKRVDR